MPEFEKAQWLIQQEDANTIVGAYDLQAGLKIYQSTLDEEYLTSAVRNFKMDKKVFEIVYGKKTSELLSQADEKVIKLASRYDFVNNDEKLEVLENHKICLFGTAEQKLKISWYRSDYTLRAINYLLKAGIKTNIHYVLQSDTISEALERLKEKTFPDGINAIVFLLHKPVRLGSIKKLVKIGNRNFQEFINYVGSEKLHYKIGFDSCTVPALLQNPGNIDLVSLDTCEAARWSAYVTPDLKLLPCSFDNQNQKWAVDLHKYSIQEAWNSSIFEDFRNKFRNSCPDCQKRQFCLGGCPILPQINLCPNK